MSPASRCLTRSRLQDFNNPGLQCFPAIVRISRFHDLIVDKAQRVTISSSGGFNISRVKYFRYFEISRAQELMMSRLQAIRFSIPLTFSRCPALGSSRCQGLATSRLSYLQSAETFKYSDFQRPKTANKYDGDLEIARLRYVEMWRRHHVNMSTSQLFNVTRYLGEVARVLGATYAFEMS